MGFWTIVLADHWAIYEQTRVSVKGPIYVKCVVVLFDISVMFCVFSERCS